MIAVGHHYVIIKIYRAVKFEGRYLARRSTTEHCKKICSSSIVTIITAAVELGDIEKVS